MTNEEIGKELNMHPKAVDSLYRRASATRLARQRRV